jgi:hypothetical protein
MTIKNNQLEDAPRTQTKSSTIPPVGPTQGAYYTKDVTGIAEAFYVDSTGREIQMTQNGNMKVPAVGEINTSSNAGSIGEGLALPKLGVDLPFKRIKAGNNVTLTPFGTYVEINAAFPPPSGESNTASNVGASGYGIYKAKSGVNLQFKNIVAGSNIILVDLGNEIQINAGTGGGGGGGEANTASNLGTFGVDGVGIYSAKVGVDLRFKRIKAGSGITLTEESNDILITSTGGGGSGSGDMLKSVYDTNDDGKVNSAVTADQLNAQLPGFYLNRTNHTGTQGPSTISGLASVATQGTLTSLSDTNISSTPTNGQVLTWSAGTSKWVAGNPGSGAGDMLKSVYDPNNDGIVADSDKLGTQLPSFYLTRSNHTGTQAHTTITGLATVASSGSYNDLTSKPTIPTTLNTITDVLAPTPANGQVLQWNSTSSKWVNGTASGSGDMLKSVYDSNDDGKVNSAVTSDQLNAQLPGFYLSRGNHTGTQAAGTITGLATVATSGSYNDLTSKPTVPTNLDSLTDVTAPTPTSGQILSWNGSAWVNSNAGSGDMLKTTYDTNTSGVVDNSERLNAQLPSFYLDRANHTGTLNLDDLSNVTCPTPVTNDVLQWNGTAWVNAAGGGGGGATTLDGLTDVTIATPSDQQFLRYNSGSSQWVNTSVTIPTNLDALTDVVVSSPTNLQFLRHNGTNWVNTSVTIPTNLDSLTDVTISTPSTDQVLKYNGSAWVNGTVSGGGGSGTSTLFSTVSRYAVLTTSGETVYATSSSTVHTGLSWSQTTTSLVMTHASHGRSIGDLVILKNVSLNEIAAVITASDTDTFTVTMSNNTTASGISGAYSCGFTFAHNASGASKTGGSLTAPSGADVKLLSIRIRTGSRTGTTYAITLPASGLVNGAGEDSSLDTFYLPVWSVRSAADALGVVAATIGVNSGGGGHNVITMANLGSGTDVMMNLNF